MRETRTGYCPVHDREITVEFEISPMKTIGTKLIQHKVSKPICQLWVPSAKECANCPITY